MGMHNYYYLSFSKYIDVWILCISNLNVLYRPACVIISEIGMWDCTSLCMNYKYMICIPIIHISTCD